MAGFVLVLLASVLVGSVMWTIERGRRPHDPFAPRPWSDLEGWECDHPDVPHWAWLEGPDLWDAAAWAAEMDASVGSYEEQEARWKALCSTHDATDAAIRVPIADVGMEVWNENVEHARDLHRVARASWDWAVKNRQRMFV